MGSHALEVADIFRTHGPAWRLAQRTHLSLGQLKVMSAIEQCRTAALGGHVLRCPDCGQIEVAYNSCRNRHYPKCQASAARRWLEARQADLLPVDYYHVVFTLPEPGSAIAYYNKAVIYGLLPAYPVDCQKYQCNVPSADLGSGNGETKVISHSQNPTGCHGTDSFAIPAFILFGNQPDRQGLLFEVAAETLGRIAADPRHLGAQIGVTLVLHTWGSALTHHPHVHGIVPGGGLAPDGLWVSCKPGFFLPVRVLSRLFRRRFLEELERAHLAGQLRFFGEYAALGDARAFASWLAPLRECEWVVYAKRPLAGPAAVLAYLSRYTHRVAIANSRLVSLDEHGVTFRWKDYRARGAARHKTMTLGADEFMRRFLLHVLPGGFHRIRHFGLLANAGRKENIARARELLFVQAPVADVQSDHADAQPATVAPTFSRCSE